MKVFLDANVLVSVINKEYPVYGYSARILSLTENSRYKIYTSPICLAIAYYFAEKKCGNKLARKKMDILIENLKITVVNQEIILAANTNKKVHDLEDGFQYYSALDSGCEFIVTENGKDFHFSEIPVLSSRAFCEKHVFKNAK